MVCHDLGHRADRRLVHDDGITFGMTRAKVVAVDMRNEMLTGLVLGDRAGYDVCTTVLTIQIDLKIGLGVLLAVRHDLFVRDQRSALGKLGARDALGGIHALDLGSFHLHI